jgi:murein L,D-transpeptidase YafK
MPIGNFLSLRRVVVIACAAALLGACQDSMVPKDIRPVPNKLVSQMERGGMKETSPIFIRIYKEESQFEVWKQRPNGQFALLKTYDICKWSGVLGPKVKEGDRQAPEGFYTVTPGQMNPKSNYYLSFNIGFPNAYDRAHGRTGSNLMVHGACSSAGCYAMEDEQIAEIYALARDAFRGGQRDFQVQAYPFRMTPANMARHANDPNMPFWKKLKEGSDHFEVAGLPPKVGVCGSDYVFNAKPVDPRAKMIANARCPQLDVPDNIEVAVAAKEMRDETAYQVALAEIKLQEQLQQAPAQSDVVMTASIQDQGDAADTSDAQADKVLGEQVAETAAAPAEEKPAEPEFTAGGTPTVVQADADSVPSAATAFSGVWGKLVGVAGSLRSLGDVKGNEDAGAEEADPITTGSVPTPAEKPDDKSAALNSELDGGLPRLTPATAFLPVIVNDDPFVIFDYFAEVDGVSVPADMAIARKAPQERVPEPKR